METKDQVTLLSSVKQFLNKSIILGDTEKSTSMFMYNLYCKLIDYCTTRESQGEDSYTLVKRELITKKENLKRDCSKICKVRNYILPANPIPIVVADWFLPNLGLLAAMKTRIPNFADGYYWSCEADAGSSTARYFFCQGLTTYSGDAPRSQIFSVRPVRSFTTFTDLALGSVGQYGVTLARTSLGGNPESWTYYEAAPANITASKWLADVGQVITELVGDDLTVCQSNTDAIIQYAINIGDTNTAAQNTDEYILVV